MPIYELFCGGFSPQPWHDGMIGVCWFEVHILFPVVTLCTIISLVYCFVLWNHLAFDSFYCSAFYFRSAIDICIITNSGTMIVLGFLLPYYKEEFLINSRFIAIHNFLTALLWITIFIFDFLHGKATKYSSRGPWIHLLFSLVYFLCCAINCWSFKLEIDNVWRPYVVTSCYVHILLLCLHFFSKVPMFYPLEEPRRRRARMLRLNIHGLMLTTDYDSIEITQNIMECEDSASCLSKLCFCWVNNLVCSGYYGELYSLQNLPTIPKRLNTYTLESKIPKIKLKFPTTDEPVELSPGHSNEKFTIESCMPFVKAGFEVFGREFLLLGFLKLLLSGFSLCGPVILNLFILSLTDSQTPSWSCILVGFSLIFMSLLITVLSTSYNYRMANFGFKVRVSVTGMVYRTILSLKTSSLNSVGTGSLVNYLTSDADRIVNFAPSVHEVWAMPFQLFVAVGLLYHQLGLACLVGIGFLIVLLPLNRILAAQIGKFSRRLMLYKDTRIKLMSEILSNMLSVKLSCWESLMKNRIIHSRVQELSALRGQKLLDACCVFFWAVCPALLASSTFATYVAIGNELKASVVFSSLALFGMLIGPMNAFPWVINGVMEAAISMQRITKLFYLVSGSFPFELTDTPLSDVEIPSDHPIVCSFAEKSTISMPVNIMNESFYYINPENLVLKNITLQVQWGELVCVIGPVGCGKSSLLLSVLGELQSVVSENELINDKNIKTHPRLRYAYVGQTPWLHAGTIRENILFGSDCDITWMNTVIEACALKSDLDQLPNGLDTVVGEASGSNLSGGQRARVALARAVYQKADIYLLDDPLSALDVDVGQQVVNNCLLGLLSGRTRIIVTHRLDWLINNKVPNKRSQVDFIIELKDGSISRKIPGSHHYSDDIHDQSSSDHNSISAINESTLSNDNQHDDNIDSNCCVLESDDVPLISAKDDTTVNQSESNQINVNSNSNNSVNVEHMEIGSISPHIYKSYVRAVGYILTFAIILSLVLMQGTRNAADWWLSHWVQDGNSSAAVVTSFQDSSYQTELFPVHYIKYNNFFLHSTYDLLPIAYNSSISEIQTITDSVIQSDGHNYTAGYYLKIYAFIVTSNLIATIFRAVLFAFGGLVAASVVHESALDTILEGRLSYFNTTPQGRILNRFASDIGTVDDALPFQLNILLASLAGLLGALVIVCISLPTLIFFLLPLVFIFWSIQRLYRGAARDLKRISSVVRSPVYAHFTDTLSGLVVIRGLGQEIRFRHLTASKLADQIRAELASLSAGCWLSFRLQLIGSVVITGAVVISLFGRLFNWAQVASVGLSIVYALNISGLMTSVVHDMTETEKNIVAVERCQELIDDTPIECDTISIKSRTPQLRSSSHNHLRLPKERKNGITYPTELSPNWPSSGSIYFNNVSLTYRQNTQSTNEQLVKALDEVSFSIKPGECVGIVGRTGSGKSSLIKVLTRLVDHLPGPYTNQYIANQTGFIGTTGQVFVDDIDIRTIPLSLLRSRILTICQEPFLFSGCLRDNLDPENQLSDSVLEDVLLKCQLATSRLKASEWLLREVGESGCQISAGQRQLICLARALLRQPRPKIICLDEATALIDSKCEETIHQILDQEFHGATILLIAHRLASIRRLCSRVMVMQFRKINCGWPTRRNIS
ncbi:Multidrug resistance-associated protein [Schistosoma japonicum]|uniref:ABC-type xenobiotic transporter n=1 Tax=Schistosoma japonicum TaxID=6182 RepID=A0A4Z2DB19_SCHJA|nr:Multidrug resistance-associated protein [Schistosoma japonicum]